MINLLFSGSIRRRLIIQLLGSAVILAGFLFLLLQSFARELAEESQDSILFASVSSILDSVSVQSGQLTADIPYAALSMLGNVSDDRVFYKIMADDEFITGYSDLPHADVEEEPQGLFETKYYKEESVRIVTATRRLASNSKPIIIAATVAQTIGGQNRKLDQVTQNAVWIGLGFFAFAAILSIWVAQTGIRPLNQLANAVSRRGPQDLRPVIAPVPTEMAPLVSSLNQFIARLDQSLSRSEDFITEAAHRVRTPLATVRTQAEIALRRVERPENRASLKEMIRAIDESSRAANQLLDHAMVSFRTDHLEKKPTNIVSLIDDIVRRIQPLASLRDIEIDFECKDFVELSVDSLLIQNALTNIIDNAIKYSPPETTICVDFLLSPETVVIEIRDLGPGFSGNNVERLTERFTRGTNTGTTVGSGLGLTIALDSVQAHGGTLELSNRIGEQGACVTLTLPR